MKTIEKTIFLSNGGILKVIYFFSLPILCHLLSFLTEIIFFSPAEACLCAVRALCLPHPERPGQAGRGPGGAAASRKPQAARTGGQRGRAERALPLPCRPLLLMTLCITPAVARAAPSCSARGSLPRLPTHCLCPHTSSCPWNPRQAQGSEIAHSGMPGHPDSCPLTS